MTETRNEMSWKAAVFISVFLNLVAGGTLAWWVAREPAGYVASTTFYILFLFVLCPLIVVLIVAAVVAAIKNKARNASVFLISCALLPIGFFGGLKLMEIGGLARYVTSGLNEMQSMDAEPNGSVTIVYNKGTSFEQREHFSNQIIHPWKEGPGFTHETGVCSSMGLLDVADRPAEKVFFCASATEKEKEKLRMGVEASQIVYRFFENVPESEVRKQLEPTNFNKKL